MRGLCVAVGDRAAWIPLRRVRNCAGHSFDDIRVAVLKADLNLPQRDLRKSEASRRVTHLCVISE